MCPYPPSPIAHELGLEGGAGEGVDLCSPVPLPLLAAARGRRLHDGVRPVVHVLQAQHIDCPVRITLLLQAYSLVPRHH